MWNWCGPSNGKCLWLNEFNPQRSQYLSPTGCDAIRKNTCPQSPHCLFNKFHKSGKCRSLFISWHCNCLRIICFHMQIQFKMLKRGSWRLPENSWETHSSFSKMLKQKEFSGCGGETPTSEFLVPEKLVSMATTSTSKPIYTLRKQCQCTTKQLYIKEKLRQQSCRFSKQDWEQPSLVRDVPSHCRGTGLDNH